MKQTTTGVSLLAGLIIGLGGFFVGEAITKNKCNLQTQCSTNKLKRDSVATNMIATYVKWQKYVNDVAEEKKYDRLTGWTVGVGPLTGFYVISMIDYKSEFDSYRSQYDSLCLFHVENCK